jgi:hypothetical protein
LAQQSQRPPDYTRLSDFNDNNPIGANLGNNVVDNSDQTLGMEDNSNLIDETDGMDFSLQSEGLSKSLDATATLLNRTGVITTGISLIEAKVKSSIIKAYKQGANVMESISDYKGVAKIGNVVQKIGYVGFGVSTLQLLDKINSDKALTTDYIRYGIGIGTTFIAVSNPVGILSLGIYGIVDALYGDKIWNSTGINE